MVTGVPVSNHLRCGAVHCQVSTSTSSPCGSLETFKRYWATKFAVCVAGALQNIGFGFAPPVLQLSQRYLIPVGVVWSCGDGAPSIAGVPCAHQKEYGAMYSSTPTVMFSPHGLVVTSILNSTPKLAVYVAGPVTFMSWH